MAMKKIFRSRSATFNVMLVMIVTLVAGIVLIVAGYSIATKSKQVNDDKKCQLSFFAAAQMSKVYSKSKRLMDVPVALECPRRDVVIDTKDTVRGGRIVDDLVKGKIANEIMSCWSKTGAGKLDPSKAGGMLASTDERFCLICSEISFSDDFKRLADKQRDEKGNPYRVKGLAYWAATRRVPGKRFSLFEFISGRKISNLEALKKLKEQEDKFNGAMDLDSKYAIFWRLQGELQIILTVLPIANQFIFFM